MPYSSGTIGLPKGVMLTHHNARYRGQLDAMQDDDVSAQPHVSQSHHNRRRHLRRAEVEATEPSVLTLTLSLELRVAL